MIERASQAHGYEIRVIEILEKQDATAQRTITSARREGTEQNDAADDDSPGRWCARECTEERCQKYKHTKSQRRPMGDDGDEKEARCAVHSTTSALHSPGPARPHPSRWGHLRSVPPTSRQASDAGGRGVHAKGGSRAAASWEASSAGERSQGRAECA